jgi:hypothetical protein
MMAILPEEFDSLVGAELHGHALFHGTKAFGPLRSMIDLRVRLYRLGLEALVRATTDIIFVGVDWTPVESSEGLELHRMHAVAHLLPLVDRQVCLDGSGECRVVDSVLFVDSQDSPGVQCTDLAMFLHARVSAGRDTNRRAITANRKLYRVLEDCRIVEDVHDGP